MAHLNLGKAYINLGIYNKAEKELQQVVSVGGGDSRVEAHRYLAVVYIETKNNTRAVEELEQYLSLAPKAKDADKIREIVKQLLAQK
jgi:lipopolysaccharide biosynthesis regulator YciM